jgi:hypothetical protein
MGRQEGGFKDQLAESIKNTDKKNELRMELLNSNEEMNEM